MQTAYDGTALTALTALTAGRVDASTRRVLHPSSTVKLRRRLGGGVGPRAEPLSGGLVIHAIRS